MTLDQRRRVRSAGMRLALQEVGRILDDAFRPLERQTSGLVQVRFERGRVETPPLLTYLEKETVREKVCRACGARSAVYGIAVACPLCGVRNSQEIFVESLRAARACLASVGDLPLERRVALQASGGEERLAENALSDAVTAFEVYCRSRYRELQGDQALRDLFKARGPGVFQRLDEAVSAMETVLQKSVENSLDDAEVGELRLAFATRHLLTHNFGVSDARYRAVGGRVEVGHRVQVTRTTAERALTLTERLIIAMS